MLEKIIITLTEEEINSFPIFHGFYSMIGRRLGHAETSNTGYNCTKICIAQNIQDKCFEYYEQLGNDSTSIAMNLCMAGPKVDQALKDNQVSIEAGYITEDGCEVEFSISTLPVQNQEINTDKDNPNQANTPADAERQGQLNEYTVRIILSEMTIVAKSSERAEEIAGDIYESDARTHLNHGLSIVGFDVVEEGTSDEDEETKA